MGSLAQSLWRLLPTRALSEAIGWGARRPIPLRVREPFLRQFGRLYAIAVEEAEKPLREYATLDDFFTRRLRDGLRPVDLAPGVVVGPADGVVVESGLVQEGRLLQAKGVLFGLADLLADQDAARRLDGGAYLITYLSPRDYHRVHASAAGRVLGWHHVPGTLFSVNARSVAGVPGLFASNERFVTLMDGEAGLCAVVMVAAVGVGHVTAAYDAEVTTHGPAFQTGVVRHKTFDPSPVLARGAELATFHLGSTTVVVFEPGRVLLDEQVAGAQSRMGRRIGRIVSPRSASG